MIQWDSIIGGGKRGVSLSKPKIIKGWGQFHLKGGAPNTGLLDLLKSKNVSDGEKKMNKNFEYKEEDFPPLKPPKMVRGWGHFLLKGGSPSLEDEIKKLQKLYDSSKSIVARMSLKKQINDLEEKLLEKDSLRSNQVLADDFSNMHHLVDNSDVASVSETVKGTAGTDISLDEESTSMKSSPAKV